MLTIGILGAGGFIGSRAVEILQTKAEVKVHPIIRHSGRTGLLSQPNLNCRTAHALDESALQKAFEGCDVVIHAVTGNPGLIRGTVSATYRAAQRAGVRRLIYTSTMCVHGQAPAQGTNEGTPLTKPQPFPYNSAKIDAERSLLKLRNRGSVEVVIFRPGIVFGPRSPRIVEITGELLSGTSYLVNGGQGICNTTYVDNLVHAMWLAINTPAADGQAFFIGEEERVTWANFYQILAQALGINPAQIPAVLPASMPSYSLKHKLVASIRDSVFVQTLLSSNQLKRKTQISSTQHQAGAVFQHSPVERLAIEQRQRVVTYEMSLLHQSPYKLPHNKANRILGYQPVVSFTEAVQKTIQWLASEGYPITGLKAKPTSFMGGLSR